jgi:hypothetical protein
MKKIAIALMLGALSLGACGQDSTSALKALDPDNDGSIDLSEAQAGAT